MVNKMNEILKISINEVSKYKEKYKDAYIVELDGKKLKIGMIILIWLLNFLNLNG